MRGNIQWRGENKFRIRIYLGLKPNGKKDYFLSPTYTGGKRDAENKRTELLAKFQRGERLRPSKVTVAQHFREWLAGKQGIAPSTRRGYKTIIEKHIIPALGKMKLSDVEPRHIEMFYRQALEDMGLSPNYVRRFHAVLSGGFGKALRWNMVNSSPVPLAEVPRGEKKRFDYWTKEEMKTFLDSAEEHQYYSLLYVLAYTGMRISEALALRWSDSQRTWEARL